MIVKTEITKTVLDTDKVEKIIRDLLDERFGDEFTFGPIEITPRVFDDGEYADDYLQIFIVFDGDPERLPASWTAKLPGVHGTRHAGDGMGGNLHLKVVRRKVRMGRNPSREEEGS